MAWDIKLLYTILIDVSQKRLRYFVLFMRQSKCGDRRLTAMRERIGRLAGRGPR